MKKQKNNYSQLDRCILETADGQFFIDKNILMKKVMNKVKDNILTESEIENRLQKLTEQKALSLHTCYALEDRSITNEFIIRVAKIMIPIAITAAIAIQLYFIFIS